MRGIQLEKVRMDVSRETVFLLENPEYAKIARHEMTPECLTEVVTDLDKLLGLIAGIRKELGAE